MAVAIVATALAYLPIVAHPNSTTLLAPGDETSAARDYWSMSYQHKTPFTLVRDRMLDAPFGQPGSPAVQVSIALQPLWVLALHPAAGYLGALNLFFLVGVAASLAAMYLLLESLGMHPLAASAGAVAFASSQWTIEQLLYGHIAFAQVWVFPLLLWLLLRARSGSPYRAILPGLAYALSFYAFPYLGLLNSLVVVVLGLALLWRDGFRHLELKRIGIGLGAAIAGLLPVALAPRIAPTSRIGLPTLNTSNLFGAPLRDFFLPSSRHIVYGSWFESHFGFHAGEHVVFFGYATLALACVAVVMLLRKTLVLSLPLRFALLAVPFGWFAALPAHETILGTKVALPDPAELIGAIVSWWRIYERLGVVAGFGLVILASASIDRLLRSGRRLSVALAALAIAAVLVEALPGLPPPTFRIHADPATLWLRAHPGGIVANYPLQPAAISAWENMDQLSQYLQIVHHHPLLGARANLTNSLSYKSIATWYLSNLSDPVTPSVLRAEGVRWVVVHRDVYAALHKPAPHPASGFVVAARFPGVQLLHVAAPPADLQSFILARSGELARSIAGRNADATYGKGFLGRERYQGFTNAHWLDQDGSISLHRSSPLPFIVYDLEVVGFSANIPRTITVFDGTQKLGSLSFATSLSTVNTDFCFPGTGTKLTFVASPGPTALGASDPRQASVYFESVAAIPVGLDLAHSNPPQAAGATSCPP